MTLEPGVHIETLQNPALYTPAQISYAAALAAELHRGKLIIVEPPANQPPNPGP